MHRYAAASSLALALLAGCAATDTAVAPPSAAAPAQAPATAQNPKLAAFFEAAFNEALAQSPQGLTSLGRKERYGELNDYTPAAFDKQLALGRAQLARMEREFDYDALSPADQLSYRLFKYNVEQGERLAKWRWHDYAVTSNGVGGSGVPVMLINQHRVASVEDARAYIARLREVERVANEVAADLAERERRGIVSPSFVYGNAVADTRKLIGGAPFGAGDDNAVWADFKAKVGKLDADAAAKAQLLDDAEAALKGPYRRGYEKLIATVGDQAARATSMDGVWRLPEGDAYYADQVRFFTTTDLTPAQIHQIGLDEVTRIQGEMEQIKQRVGFGGTLRQFFEQVKNGEQHHYPNTPEGKAQYLADAETFVAGYMAVAPQYFHRLPKQAVDVRAVEPFRESTAAVAFYNPGTPDGSRPGIYYVNLSDMRQVLKPQIEGITYHEAAPGHHFQIAFAQEQQGLPMFRRLNYAGAYIEGWGLYAERQAKEAGFYTDPYSDFGRLSLEAWRAVRLVVDTGIHAKRWSRKQAQDYMRENTLLSERDIEKEVDRYITNPGQATSYKIGQLKILELREKARTALGSRFDIRDFHAVVLENGPIPLDVLEQQVDGYIAARR